MHKFNGLAAAVAAGVLAAAASPADAAQITDFDLIWEAGGVHGADLATDEQTGEVRADRPAYVNNAGWFILDMGSAFDIARLDLFSLLGADLVEVRAGNTVGRDGFNLYLNSGEVLFRGALGGLGDPAGALTAQSFAVSTKEAYRYLQISAASRGSVGGLNEIRLFDSTGTGAVPEPATWAMLTLGFGGLGYAIRRRRVTMSLA